MSLPMAKKTKAVGAMSALSEGEIVAVTKMMYRAAKHGQLEMVMKLLSQSPGEKHLVEEAKAKVGAMSDAAKRRRDEEPFSAADLDPDVAFEIWHQELASSFGVDWECISQMSGGSEDFHVATPKGYTSVNVPKAAPKSRYGFAKAEPVPNKYKPDDMPTAKDWSTTLCKLPKVLHLKLSYGELVELAGTDDEILDYLVWVIGSFGAKDGKLPKTMKGGADLALFLQYIDWTPIVKPSGGSTFKRELKKWSLNPRRRSMVTISSGCCYDLLCPQQRAWKFGGPRGSHNCHEIHSWMVFVAYRVKWRALELGMTYAPTAMAAWRKKDQWRDRIVAVGISFTILVGCHTRFTICNYIVTI